MTATSTTVPFAELTPAWQHALHNALDADLTVTEVRRELSGLTGHDLTIECDVASASRPGLTHRVVYVADCGGLYLSCNCERAIYRASRGDRCTHMGAVLLALGVVTTDELPPRPVKRLAHLFEDEG